MTGALHNERFSVLSQRESRYRPDGFSETLHNKPSLCCETFELTRWVCYTEVYSASVLAELSVRSPRKLIIFNISKNIFWIKVSKNHFI